MTEPLGYNWLAARCEVATVQPLPVSSFVGGSQRSTTTRDGYTRQSFPASFQPASTVAAHLTFAFRHEGVHLEFLARLFSRIGGQPLEAWIAAEPTGAYARRACFFYERLTGRMLARTAAPIGNYVDALDAERYLVAAQAPVDARWRIRDNLPGDGRYCPTVRLTEAVRAAAAFDCRRALDEMTAGFGAGGADLVRRSAIWLTIKESRASFQMENEGRETHRIQRFAAAMEVHAGAFEDSLSEASLRELQRTILGESATRYGLRQSPVYVGHQQAYVPVIDYIAPAWEDVRDLLAGLGGALDRTQGRSPILRAAIASFGFVYIHPMSDGNGRISRFLINDVLRRDGAVPAPLILPVSATITESHTLRAGYDASLEAFSKPFMRRYAGRYDLGSETDNPDGVVSDLEFDAYDDALFAWKFPDFTPQTEYLGPVIEETIRREMREEAQFLRQHDQARQAVKEVVEGPDSDIDRIIRSIQENGFRVSGKLAQQYPMLVDDIERSDRVVAAVVSAFGDARGGASATKSALTS